MISPGIKQGSGNSFRQNKKSYTAQGNVRLIKC